MVPRLVKRRKLSSGHSDYTLSDSGSEFNLEDSENNALPSPLRMGRNVFNKGQKTDTTADDLGQYADGFHHSGMFMLQMEQMLRDIKPNRSKRFRAIDDLLHRLKSSIEKIPERRPVSVAEAIQLMQKTLKVTIPFPDPKPDPGVAYKLAYSRPSNINVVGSYVTKTLSKGGNIEVDMTVTLPTSILQEKDYLNYRYFYKRAYYLSCIAVALRAEFGTIFDFNFEYLNGNTLQPILLVRPGKDSGSETFSKSKCTIRILPAVPEDFFPKNKLLPNKNAIRMRGGRVDTAISSSATPFYNSSLQAESTYAAYLKLLHAASKEANGFVDACILGRIWLRQRGFRSAISHGGFGHFEFSALMAILLKAGGPKDQAILSPAYNSYQLFKATIQYLSAHDLVSRPFIFPADSTSFSGLDCPLFFDGPRSLNILFKMTPWSFAFLREEARTTLEMLNDTTFDHFESSFIVNKTGLLEQFDSLVAIRSAALEDSVDGHQPYTEFAFKVYDNLKKGLGDRLKLMYIKLPETASWDLESTPSRPASMEIMVAFCFNPVNIRRAIDYGPSAEDKASAAEYRKFWGERAELRRFKNGTILESVIWSESAGRSIFQEITTYVLQHHVDRGVDMTFFGDQQFLLSPSEEPSNLAFSSLRESLAILEADLRRLEDLPLQLKQFSPISPQCRFSSLQIPSYRPSHPLKPPIEVIMQFEGSGRWPDDLVAIHRTKIAFLLRIGGLLEKSVDGIKTNLGLEDPGDEILNSSFLDVLYPSGLTFRLRIHSDREQLLLEHQIKAKSSEARAREKAAKALSSYTRMYIHLPVHSQSVIQSCTRYPTLSESIRLMKKWFEAHLLSQHFQEELVELLVLRTYLQPYPWAEPSSPMTGFLRTLLFLSRWDWRSTPLIVDFSGSLSSKDVTTVYTRLEAWRKIDPSMNRTVLVAATNHNLSGTAFSDGMPSKVVATRMTSLARSACEVLKKEGLGLDTEELFSSPIEDFDFVFHLAKSSQKSVISNDLTQHREVFVGYNPVLFYLEELKMLYGTNVLLFHRPGKLPIICGLWNPQTASRSFKINLTYNTRPLLEAEEGEGEGGPELVALDKEAILLEMVRLGKDLVTKVETHN